MWVLAVLKLSQLISCREQTSELKSFLTHKESGLEPGINGSLGSECRVVMLLLLLTLSACKVKERKKAMKRGRKNQTPTVHTRYQVKKVFFPCIFLKSCCTLPLECPVCENLLQCTESSPTFPSISVRF